MDKSTDVCVHEGEARKLGERWQQSDCVHCVCQENRVVSCQAPMCKSCDNAIPPHPGECCPHCPPLTNKTHHESELSCPNSLEGCELVCQRGYATDENNCPVCECDVSEVRNERRNAMPWRYFACKHVLYTCPCPFSLLSYFKRVFETSFLKHIYTVVDKIKWRG